jgi:hypothetical protein
MYTSEHTETKRQPSVPKSLDETETERDSDGTVITNSEDVAAHLMMASDRFQVSWLSCVAPERFDVLFAGQTDPFCFACMFYSIHIVFC